MILALFSCLKLIDRKSNIRSGQTKFSGSQCEEISLRIEQSSEIRIDFVFAADA